MDLRVNQNNMLIFIGYNKIYERHAPIVCLCSQSQRLLLAYAEEDSEFLTPNSV